MTRSSPCSLELSRAVCCSKYKKTQDSCTLQLLLYHGLFQNINDACLSCSESRIHSSLTRNHLVDLEEALDAFMKKVVTQISRD